ncbi:MAG: putative toxin-antitoxin system toxin component, PIN family, partial [Anaerolineae bacterium]|nr:putative toxin-antitoxin system toxin component, PIN family [Anaerolineae bacterium]
IARHSDIEWIASQAILSEYIEVLRRPKFGLSAALLREWEAVFNMVITVIDVSDDVEFPRDPKDAKFLACAIVGEADYLITSDKDFTDAYALMLTTVCSVSHFKATVVNQYGSGGQT